MTSSLATKQDLAHLEQLMVTRLEALESRFSLRIRIWNPASSSSWVRSWSCCLDWPVHCQDWRAETHCPMADMTSNLATKDDVLLLRQEIERFRQSMLMRFDCLEGRFKAIDTRSDSVESRIAL